MKQYTMMMDEKDRHRLEKLCEAMNLSPQRGKSIAISRLINHAKVSETTPDLKELPNKEYLELLREELQNMVRLGGNLNQLVHLLEIRRIRLDCGETEELVVEADFLVAVLKEINEEVDDIKAMMKSFVSKY